MNKELQTAIDERLELNQLDWLWTKYAENGGMPPEELAIIETGKNGIILIAYGAKKDFPIFSMVIGHCNKTE